jgi:cytochrome c oxidase subunit 2
VAPLAVLLASCSGAGPQSSLDPQGPIGRSIDDLWILVFVIATVVFVLVQGALLVAIFRFREKKGVERSPKQTHGNTRLEIIWTIVPAVLLAALAVPTLDTLFDIRAEAAENAVQVKVTGHQWWWEFEYSDYTDATGRALYTANELHIPAGRDVQLTMSSADVIHSFWVPPLNGKRDVVPGKVTKMKLNADASTVTLQYDDFGEGWILGQCAEFCGLAHADMRLRVKIHTEEEFAAWTEQQLAPAPLPAEETLTAEGWQTFQLVCTACHQATVLEEGERVVYGLGLDRFVEVGDDGDVFHFALAPDLTHFGSRTTFAGASYDNVEEHLRAWLRNPSDLKPMDPDRNDIPAGLILGMPNFNLDDEQISGLIELLDSWK